MIKNKLSSLLLFKVLFAMTFLVVFFSQAQENGIFKKLEELENKLEKKYDHKLNNEETTINKENYQDKEINKIQITKENEFDGRGNLAGRSLLCEGKESRIFGLGEKKRTKRLYEFKSPTEVQLLIVYLSDERIWLINKNDSPSLKYYDLFYVYKTSSYSKEEKINIHFFEIDVDGYKWFPWHESIDKKELKIFSIFKNMKNFNCFFVDSNTKNNLLEIYDTNINEYKDFLLKRN